MSIAIAACEIKQTVPKLTSISHGEIGASRSVVQEHPSFQQAEKGGWEFALAHANRMICLARLHQDDSSSDTERLRRKHR